MSIILPMSVILRRSRRIPVILRDPSLTLRMTTKGTGQKGFTLIEMIFAMVVIAAIVVVVAQLMVIGLDSYSLISSRREALNGARTAMNMMTSDIQKIANPATDITTIQATNFTFTLSGSPVTYQISGTNLLKGSDVLASNVTANSGFAYYTAGGASTSDQTLVYRITITLEVDTGAVKTGKILTRTNVYLRNRYYSGYIQN